MLPMPSIDPSRRFRVGPLCLLLALSACTSVPLGPWDGPNPAPRTAPIASPPAPVLPPLGGPAAQPIPVPSGALPPSAPLDQPPAAAPPASAPYGPAVAARFPDPAVEIRTPAFAPGHAGYTSNAELHAALVGLVRTNDQRLGGTEVRLLLLGTSQNGTPLEALLFARGEPGVAPPASGRVAEGLVAGRPTVLLIGQQHGDEPAGAEALLVIAQQLAHGRLEPLLDRINVVVLPRANPDGAEANRRSSVNGLDVNRDHLLLKTPEAQAQARLMREFAPAVVVDAHEYTVVGRYLAKFDAVQRYDALLQYAMTANLPEFVSRASEEWFREPVVARLKGEGLTSQWYYTTSTDPNDKKLSMGGTQPDTGRNVDGLTNAVSLLIETRGVGIGKLHLKRRVHTHVVAIESVLQSAATRAPDLVKLRQYVDQEVSSLACQGDLVVEAGPTASEYQLLMLDPTTGADKPVTVAWDSALELHPLKTRARPCGYWLAETEGDAVQHLRALGIRVERFDQLGEVQGEAYRETTRETGVRQDVRGALYDGAGVLHVKVQTIPALIDLKAGGYYVPLDQPLANLAVAALEPDTQNSFFANGIISAGTAEARVLMRPEMKTTAVP
ncbi:MAG: M14 family metallocarboxypeptidase [Caldimonas sp.]